MWTGMFHLMAGRLDDAEQTIAVLGTSRDLNFINSWAAQFFTLRREQGQTQELEAAIAAAADASPGLVALRTVHLMARTAAGDHAGARETLHELTADNLAAIPPDSTLPASLANLTEVCTELGDRDAAAALFEQLLPYSGQLLVIAWGATCLGAADRFLAMLDMVLGRYDRAEERFGRALALEEACRCRCAGDAHAVVVGAYATRARSVRRRRREGTPRRRRRDRCTSAASTGSPRRSTRSAERNAHALCFLHGTIGDAGGGRARRRDRRTRGRRRRREPIRGGTGRAPAPGRPASARTRSVPGSSRGMGSAPDRAGGRLDRRGEPRVIAGRALVTATPIQGEIWWAEAQDKRRPVLVVTRTEAVPVLTWIVCQRPSHERSAPSPPKSRSGRATASPSTASRRSTTCNRSGAGC